MNIEASDLLQELVNLLNDTQLEVKALRDVLIDKKLTTDKELQLRIEDVRRERHQELKSLCENGNSVILSSDFSM